MVLELEPHIEYIQVKWEASLVWESNNGNEMRYEISDERIFNHDDYEETIETSGKDFPKDFSKLVIWWPLSFMPEISTKRIF